MRRMFRDLRRDLVELLYPGACVGCDAVGEAGRFCGGCRAGLPLLPPAERAPQALGLEGPRVSAVARYGDPLRHLILQAKLGADPTPWPALANLLADEAPDLPILEGVDLVVAVPADPRRRRARGFDHAAWLARCFARRRFRPFDAGALRRAQRRVRQARLGREARRENLAGSFTAEAERVGGARVLVVDDVCTTGSTLSEAARAVELAGAASVLGLVLCRHDR